MPRTNQTAEFNTFVKGLITEASPLTFPENSSIDEDNFVLLRDGSRRRRLGMDFESSYQEIAGDLTFSPSLITSDNSSLVSKSYEWRNAGGNARNTFIVYQLMDKLFFFDSGARPLSSGLITSVRVPLSGLAQDLQKSFSFATVDGILVVATGEKSVISYVYDDNSSTISESSSSLLIRDFFGVEDIVDGEDLLEGQGLTVRPDTIPSTHLYNLRNQTWAKNRATFIDGTGTVDVEIEDPLNPGETTTVSVPVLLPNNADPIKTWNDYESTFPSNSDNINYGLLANPESSGDKTIQRFNVQSVKDNPVGTFRAPAGYFVIDALERGKSRVEEEEKLSSVYNLSYRVNELPVDSTPGGASVVAEYAGRVWYAGFSGDIDGGDSQSPNMSSYVLYSQSVRNSSDINKCYQEADPTSEQVSDLIDTDGGYIRLDGAYNIQAMVNVSTGLAVFAENGVWMISGGGDYSFTANAQLINKVSEQGCISPDSIVLVEGTLMFWGSSGIFHLSKDQFGSWIVQSISDNIQTYYDDIEESDKNNTKGIYDSYEKKVRWSYTTGTSEQEPIPKELVLDIVLQAFYPSTISKVGNLFPRPIAPFKLDPFKSGEVSDDIVFGGDSVTYLSNQVAFTRKVRQASTREVAYFTISDITEDDIFFTVSSYKDNTFVDWKSFDGTGVDAPAFLLTGYINNGDYQRFKQVPYVYFHLRRTEDGFEELNGDLVPTSQSSCKVQSQWDWANSSTSGKWGREFQAYRYKRLYIPEDVNDDYDFGFSTIVTKNKLRGRGRVVSLLISTEEGKDLDLLGWSLTLGSNGNV